MKHAPDPPTREARHSLLEDDAFAPEAEIIVRADTFALATDAVREHVERGCEKCRRATETMLALLRGER